MPEVKEMIEDINKSFQEFKARNDKRLEELEKGRQDPLIKEEVDRIAKEVDEIAEIKDKLEAMETKLNRPGLSGNNPDELSPEEIDKKTAVVKYLRHGERALSAEEYKLLSVSSDPQGGYLVEGEMSQKIITKVYETSPMRQEVTVETISSDALEIPDDLGEPDSGWVGETGSRPETNTPTIGVRRIPVHELYAMPKATQKLLDDAKINVEGWLGGKVSDKVGRTENTSFVTGSGVDRPRGFLTYPAGSTNPGQIQQVNSGHASQLTGDGLVKLFNALKASYLVGAKWMTSRPGVQEIMLLKDGQGNYLFNPGLKEGATSMILGQPIVRMEDMPAVAANSLSVAFGNWREAYTIVDRAGVRILRDPFSAKPFVLFYTTKRTGGDVTNFEALVIQKTAA